MKNRGEATSGAKLFFAYRLTTARDAYIGHVLEGVKAALETERSVHVILAFVKGIDRASAEEVLRSVREGIGEIEGSFCARGDSCFIRVSPFLDISLQAIRRVEGKSNVI